MIFRIATLNLEQDHKCWEARRELIVAQAREVKPDFWALNEIHIPSQSARWLQAGVRRKRREHSTHSCSKPKPAKTDAFRVRRCSRAIR